MAHNCNSFIRVIRCTKEISWPTIVSNNSFIRVIRCTKTWKLRTIPNARTEQRGTVNALPRLLVPIRYISLWDQVF